MKELIKSAIQGFSMALADSVPGVSGETVAFVLGFYDKFVNSLNALISKGDKKEAIKFLAKLGSGWAIGMAIASLILSNLFETHIYQVSSLFIGFIIFAIPLYVKNKYIKWSLITLLSILICLIGVSRIYLGVHYTSDVLAGFLISISYLIIYISAVNKFMIKKD